MKHVMYRFCCVVLLGLLVCLLLGACQSNPPQDIQSNTQTDTPAQPDNQGASSDVPPENPAQPGEPEVPDEPQPCTHQYGEWQETLAPTCGETGEQSRACTLCGECETKSLPKQGEHAYVEGGACGACSAAMDAGFLFELNEDGASYAFRYDGNAAMVRVPATFNHLPVTRLNTGAFYWKTELVSVTLPDSITVIDREAFKSSANLKSVNIPDGVTVIGKNAFDGCLSLTSFTLPQGVTRIEYAAFANSGLRSIKLHDGLTYIGEEAFLGCADLTQVTIPASVREMGKNVFNSCSNLKTVTFAPGSQLTVIPENAFSSNSALSAIALPEGIVTIEKAAFSHLRALTRVELPATLQTLGDEVFRNSGTDPMTIIFHGSAEQWETVSKGNRWDQIRTYSGTYTLKIQSQ